MLLTSPTVLSSVTEDALIANADLIDLVSIFGGDAAVSGDVLDAVAAIFP